MAFTDGLDIAHRAVMTVPGHPPLRPLADDEIDRMQTLLRGFGAGAMNLAQLDGLLTALACSSAMRTPGHCLAVIAGADSGDPVDPAAAELLDLASRHRDAIAARLDGGAPLEPLLDRDEHGRPRGNDWAAGFLCGLSLDPERRSSLVDDEQRHAGLRPIFALAHEHGADAAMRSGPIDDAQRHALIVGALAAVRIAHRDLATRRSVESARTPAPTFRGAPRGTLMTADNHALQPLNDDELDRLDALLGEFGDAAMTAEELDGFLAAIASGPAEVPMAEWLPVVLGAGEGEPTPAFASAAQEREFRDLTSRHHGDIAATLARGEVWSPVMDTDEDGRPSGNGWALGFLCGVEMRARDWRDFLEDDDAGEAIEPVFELAHEDDPDPELRSDPIPDEERDEVIGRMMQGVGRIHAWFAPYRNGAATR